ncbi:MAG: hypothetical protein DRQ03_03575 [Candidatus Hydrothermota bacterium]|nr:MAG: hypothetical protein DRQ03_03575 [Candidatus Hydrothermae bacterium]
MGTVILFFILLLLFIASFVSFHGRKIILKEIGFLTAGYLLGYIVKKFINVGQINSLWLFLSVGSGYFLMLFGLQFSRSTIKKISRVSFLIAFIESGIIFLMALGVGLFFIKDLNLDLHLALLASLSASPLLIYSQKKLDSNKLYALYLDPLLAIFILLVLTLANGKRSILPMLFPLYLIFVLIIVKGLERREQEMNLFLFGSTTLLAGLSLSHKIEPVIPPFITGLLISNLGNKYRRGFLNFLQNMEKSIYLAFLVLIGFFLKPVFNVRTLMGILVISAIRGFIKYFLFRSIYAMIPGPMVLAIGSGFYILTGRGDFLFYFTFYYVINHIFLLKGSVNEGY